MLEDRILNWNGTNILRFFFVNDILTNSLSLTEFSNDLLGVFILWFCPILLGGQDIQLIISTTSLPTKV
jgi:hypothetical protein